MKWSEAAVRRVEEYLSAVEKHLAHKPATVRKDVGGRDQIVCSTVRGLSDHVEIAVEEAGISS